MDFEQTSVHFNSLHNKDISVQSCKDVEQEIGSEITENDQVDIDGPDNSY